MTSFDSSVEGMATVVVWRSDIVDIIMTFDPTLAVEGNIFFEVVHEKIEKRKDF
jgi:hypothetical protein